MATLLRHLSSILGETNMDTRLTGTLWASILIFGLAIPAQAALIDRGPFPDGFGGMVNLIYDDDRNITWLGDANFAQTSGFDADGLITWTTATTVWAPSLTVDGFTDWRLPSAFNQDGSGPCGPAFNCMGSEMGHLFYDELGGTAVSSILASGDPDLALFSNIQADVYWSGTEFAPDPRNAWFFGFNVR